VATHDRLLDCIERRIEEAGVFIAAHRARRGVDLRKYRGRTVAKIAAFAKDLFGFEATDQQLQVFALYAAGGWAAVRSAVGIGKTVACAVVLLYHVYLEHGLVVSLAASDRQVKELLWGAVQRLWSGSGLPGELYQQALVLGRETRAIGFVTTDPAKLRGWHDRKLLVLVDESQGVPGWVWDSLVALCTGEENQVLAIGNPGPPVGPWYNVFQSPRWAHLVLSAIDHPNIRAGRELVPGGPSLSWLEHIKREYGEGSAHYRAMVLGEFCEEVGESLIERAWIDAAIARWESGEMEAAVQRALVTQSRDARYAAAIDVARFGADSTALILRQGPIVRGIATWRKCDLAETLERLIDTLAGWGVRIWPYDWKAWGSPTGDPALDRYGDLKEARLTVDSIGVGSGVHDFAKLRGFRVTEFVASHGVASPEAHKFMNRRAEAAWSLSRRFQDGRIAIPPNEALIEELLAMKYFLNPSGRIQIEAKDEIRALLGRSPDLFDALAMVMDESHLGATIGPSVRVTYG
jgi:hypothetical protein